MSKVQDTALRTSLVSFDNITLGSATDKANIEFYLSFDSLLVMDIYVFFNAKQYVGKVSLLTT